MPALAGATHRSMSLLQSVVEQLLAKIIAKYDPDCKACGSGGSDEAASGGVVELVEAMMEPMEVLWNWWRR